MSSKKEIEGLLEVKKWLQERLGELKEEKEKLETLLKAIEPTEVEESSTYIEPKMQITINDVKKKLGRELTEVLDFEQKGNIITIRRNRFLDRNVWRSATQKIQEFNGRWISAGEDSRWEIELNKQKD
jgi:sugar-specific transcriptional regulator TrmB